MFNSIESTILDGIYWLPQKKARLSFAKPIDIEKRSSGEIRKPEILDHDQLLKKKIFVPIEGGLFCEKIFGLINDYTCDCGFMGYSIDKVDRQKEISLDEQVVAAYFGKKEPDRFACHNGNSCKLCGKRIVPITKRLQRWGHINLATPVAHIWSLTNIPSNLSAILDIPVKDLKKVIYFDCHIVTQSTDPMVQAGKLLTNSQYEKTISKSKNRFTVDIGAEAIIKLLLNIDLNEVAIKIKDKIAKKITSKEKGRLSTRLKIIQAHLESGSHPSCMILEKIPILPPDLRIIFFKDNLIFTNHLNNLYQKIIYRNNRVTRLIELNAPSIILMLEKRMLQESVDELIDSSQHNYQKKESDKSPLLSLTQQLYLMVDDDPYINWCYFRNCELNNKKNARSHIKSASYAARCAKKGGREDLFIAMLAKMHGLCLKIEEIDR